MIAIITPTWDWSRALDQIYDRREKSSYGSTNVIDIVVWSGAPVPQSSGHSPVQIPVEGLDRVYLLTTPTHLSPVEAMHYGAEFALGMQWQPDLLAFIHDDVTIFTPNWDVYVEQFMAEHPLVGLCGFGGALGFGTDDIYQTPYRLEQLIRIDYRSRADDYANHGSYLPVATRVAVLDGLALIFKPLAYQQGLRGGWKHCLDLRIPFHMYDAWACLQLARNHWHVWALPIEFHHQGGATSVGHSEDFENVCKRLGFSGAQELYDSAHDTIYGEFSHVLPLRVPHYDTTKFIYDTIRKGPGV